MKPTAAGYAKACRRRLWTPESVPRPTVWMLIAIVAILALTACGGSTPEVGVGEVSQAETPAPTATAIRTLTQAPTATAPPDTPTAAPPDTPEPPTPTAPPSATDTPEPPAPTLSPTESAATEQASQTTAEGEQPIEASEGEEQGGEELAYELPFLGPPDAPVTVVEFGEYL